MSAIEKIDLHILKNGELLGVTSLSTAGEYRIGRSADCEIAIDEPRLSRTHLLLTLQAGELVIRDVSSNGTSVDGVRLAQGDLYPIRKDASVELSDGAITLMIELKKYTAQAHGVNARPPTDEEPSSQLPAGGMLSMLKQKGQLIIGRSETCDVVFPSMQVSRRHAVLQQDGNRITLEDLNTTNGTFVNGQPISATTTIQPHDSVSVGPYTFELEAGVLEQEFAIVASNVEKVYAKGFVGLNKLSIDIPAKAFVALMGPSGCGKSTLLKCLNGASPPTSGDITIQGLRLNNANFNTLKKHIGYVPQDDIVHRELSVEKTLYYAAKLRMAKDISKEEINLKIDQVLESLNLDPAAIRKSRIFELSGGQRKRISIAVELLNDPTILFLDEPTSPLDPETIEDFLTCIRGLVRRGQTVIMVTHKPSDLNYVDKVIFLAKGGYQAFYGDKTHILDHFGTDNIIEVYSLMKDSASGKKWNQKWLDLNPNTSANDGNHALKPKPRTSLLRQYFWLSVRYANIKWNDAWNILLLLAQPFIIGFLLVFIFQSLQLSVLFMLAVSAIWFGVSNASKEIVSELAIYERERMYDLNIGNYVLSKITVLAVIALIQVLVFVGIVYLAYEGRSEDVKLWGFFPNVLFMFFLSVSATVFGLFLSAVFNNAEKVMTFVPIALMPQIMLAGIIAKVDSDLKILLSYLTLGRWGTEGFAHLQDQLARSGGHFADPDQTIPASVMQYLPVVGSGPPEDTGPEAGKTFEMVMQPQGAIEQLGFYDKAVDLISLFPESLAGVITAIMIQNAIFLLAIVVALKSRDSRFV